MKVIMNILMGHRHQQGYTLMVAPPVVINMVLSMESIIIMQQYRRLQEYLAEPSTSMLDQHK